MGDCSVVDEDVDPSDLRLNLRDHALHFGGDGHVSLNRYRLPSHPCDLTADGLCGSLTVVHSDIGTSLSECDCNCGSDSATAARNKNDSILQIFHGFILRFVLCPVNPSAPHNPHSLLSPTGTE